MSRGGLRPEEKQMTIVAIAYSSSNSRTRTVAEHIAMGADRFPATSTELFEVTAG
jgi:hypothetical protein